VRPECDSFDNSGAAANKPAPPPVSPVVTAFVNERWGPTVTYGRTSTLALLGAVAAAGLAFTATAGQLVTEAPTGFDTPTLVQNPGSQSTSNGIAEPVAADTFALDQQQFEQPQDVTTGLGPVYNARACVDCHQNPVSGGASQMTELRVGHLDGNGNFVNPTIPINDGIAINGVVPTITGRSIVNDRSLPPDAQGHSAQEHVPQTENIRALRAARNLLGDGFVEAIDDRTLLGIAAQQPTQSGGTIQGEPVMVAIFEAPGQTGVGRFGWKDQHRSLLSFSADAYLNEIGVTSRLRPTDTTTIGKITSDPEDTPDSLGLAGIDHFAQFIRGTMAPPRDPVIAATPDAAAGQTMFNNLGCGICHVGTIQTAPAGTAINGGAFVVPAALGDKLIHPYSDFLLHDIGTGDGIVQGGPQDTQPKLRTAPLWGLRMRPRYMHDLKSLSVPGAIARHKGEATAISQQFFALPEGDRKRILAFLNSL
jgi:CxxC motif-containing protein (DUF1111 family)